MSKEDYQNHLRNNVTKTYKKSNRNRVGNINLDAKKIAEKIEIDGRVEKMQKTEAFLTIKAFRLINLSKPDIEKISKF